MNKLAMLAPVTALPESFAHDRDLVISAHIFFRQKRAATQRLHAEHREQTRGDLRARDAFRLALSDQIEVVVAVGGDVFKRRALLFPGEILVTREPRHSTFAGPFADRNQSFGIAKRQRAQQHRVDQTEDRGVRAEGEPERDDHDRRKAGTLCKNTD